MQRIVITGTRRDLRRRQDAGGDPRGRARGRSAIAPIEQWDASRWPAAGRGRGHRLRPGHAARRSEAAQAHPPHRRVRPVRGGQAIEAAGFAAHRETLDEDAQAHFDDATGFYVGSGGGGYQNQYDYFPLMARPRRSRGVRARAASTREPDVAAADAAEQRALPRRHPARPQGSERVHHESQRRAARSR